MSSQWETVPTETPKDRSNTVNRVGAILLTQPVSRSGFGPNRGNPPLFAEQLHQGAGERPPRAVRKPSLLRIAAISSSIRRAAFNLPIRCWTRSRWASSWSERTRRTSQCSLTAPVCQLIWNLTFPWFTMLVEDNRVDQQPGNLLTVGDGRRGVPEGREVLAERENIESILRAHPDLGLARPLVVVLDGSQPRVPEPFQSAGREAILGFRPIVCSLPRNSPVRARCRIPDSKLLPRRQDDREPIRGENLSKDPLTLTVEPRSMEFLPPGLSPLAADIGVGCTGNSWSSSDARWRVHAPSRPQRLVPCNTVTSRSGMRSFGQSETAPDSWSTASESRGTRPSPLTSKASDSRCTEGADCSGLSPVAGHSTVRRPGTEERCEPAVDRTRPGRKWRAATTRLQEQPIDQERCRTEHQAPLALATLRPEEPSLTERSPGVLNHRRRRSRHYCF